MKKTLIILITSALALSALVGCGQSKDVENKSQPEGTKAADVEKNTKDMKTTKEEADVKEDINALVTIKEVVNKEGVSPNGDKVRYIYEVPVINIDKPGAQKINDMFLNLEQDMEERIGNGQSMTIFIKSKAFLNDGIISAVMEIEKPGPGGIYAVNYDIQNDREVSTKELIEKYSFDPRRLIAEIDRQEEINSSKPEEDRHFLGPVINYFTDIIIANIHPLDDYSPDYVLEKMEEMHQKTKEEKERYIIENIDRIKAYINDESKFVFIYNGVLQDEELVVE